MILKTKYEKKDGKRIVQKTFRYIYGYLLVVNTRLKFCNGFLLNNKKNRKRKHCGGNVEVWGHGPGPPKSSPFPAIFFPQKFLQIF